MNPSEIGVLIVDDSALMRNLISKIIENTAGLAVVGKAMNGQFALEKIPSCQPDVIVLDIEMPVMTGLEFLRERKKLGIDIPVIMLSSLTTEGAAVTMQCLELGASDFLTKPGGSVSGDLSAVAARLVELLSSYGGQYARLKKNKYIPAYKHFVDPAALSAAAKSGTFGVQDGSDSSSEVRSAVSVQKPSIVVSHDRQPAVVQAVRESGKIEVIAIGISTGGPNALREVFRAIDPDLNQPVLVVQHMPAGFTEEFANSLNHICPLEVKEAHDGDLLKPGRILIAPGNHHMYVEHKSLAQVVRLSDAEPRNGHRPSVDVLFESVAAVYQNRALGVIMTGMGRDGAAQLAEMRRQGARTLGQDEKSSVVYGMPKVAWELGAVQKQVPLQDMAVQINCLAKEYC